MLGCLWAINRLLAWAGIPTTLKGIHRFSELFSKEHFQPTRALAAPDIAIGKTYSPFALGAYFEFVTIWMRHDARFLRIIFESSFETLADYAPLLGSILYRHWRRDNALTQTLIIQITIAPGGIRAPCFQRRLAGLVGPDLDDALLLALAAREPRPAARVDRRDGLLRILAALYVVGLRAGLADALQRGLLDPARAGWRNQLRSNILHAPGGAQHVGVVADDDRVIGIGDLDYARAGRPARLGRRLGDPRSHVFLLCGLYARKFPTAI